MGIVQITSGVGIKTYQRQNAKNACIYIGTGYDNRIDKNVLKVGKFENSYSHRFNSADYKKHYDGSFKVRAIVEYDNKQEAQQFEFFNLYKLSQKFEHIPNDRFINVQAQSVRFYYTDRKYITIDL